MSEEIRINRASQPVQPAMSQPTPALPKKSSKMPWVILVVVVVVLAVLGVLFRDKLFKGKAAQQTSPYQAVFLTNGQVYFGKISGGDNNYVTLKDIYYLQVVQPPLQGQQGAAQTQATTSQDQQTQISLVKLGQELHGPVDEMHISRSQILFYEDLKNDGKVVEAIKSYQANPNR